ncbi:hypothetical protein C9374_012122 [Naegleria lovaniensis]|uniref:EF-hand domain-containing protein n=1 Tax=Naegleria lovaniensis TaxID=51637 RepID=A0AA88G876_NAELO|nr:uncharacterized protein C9374_012122 [Naegleria lovaniensis]KAG2373515.1 hypothetical protein C9374_012122 [Naegleria lovaniensis]
MKKQFHKIIHRLEFLQSRSIISDRQISFLSRSSLLNHSSPENLTSSLNDHHGHDRFFSSCNIISKQFSNNYERKDFRGEDSRHDDQKIHSLGSRKKILFAWLIAIGIGSTLYWIETDDQEENGLLLLSVQDSAATTMTPRTTRHHGVINEHHGTGKKKLVVLGSGWGSVSLISDIDLNLYDVYVVSPRNYFLFTPMLPSALVGTVSLQSIIEPIRRVLERKRRKSQSHDNIGLIEYFEAECFDVDPISQTVKCRDMSNFVVEHAHHGANQFELKYDKLVIAVGAQPNSFGVKGVEEFSVPMKQPEHAQMLRERLLDALESACLPHLTEEERRNALKIVVVGGGPTGIESVGYLVDFIKQDVSKLFPKDIVDKIQIIMIHSSDHILNMYDAKIVELTEKQFKLNNVDVRTNARVIEVREKDLLVANKVDGGNKSEPYSLPFSVCIWTTGISQVPLVKTIVDKIPAQKNEKSLVINGYLQVIGLQNVYALGDCSKIQQPQLIKKYESFYEEADTNHDGILTYEELEALIKKKEKEYPHFVIINQKLKKLFEKADINHDGVLSKEEFKTLLEQIDNEYYSPLPLTAQVASRQGKYLAECLNQIEEQNEENVNLTPFMYKHLGSFAYIGSNHAVADLGAMKMGGFTTWWLYRAAYFSKQVSWKNRYCLASDWIRTTLFGRDVSRF